MSGYSAVSLENNVAGKQLDCYSTIITFTRIKVVYQLLLHLLTIPLDQRKLSYLHE